MPAVRFDSDDLDILSTVRGWLYAMVAPSSCRELAGKFDEINAAEPADREAIAREWLKLEDFLLLRDLAKTAGPRTASYLCAADVVKQFVKDLPANLG